MDKIYLYFPLCNQEVILENNSGVARDEPSEPNASEAS